MGKFHEHYLAESIGEIPAEYKDRYKDRMKKNTYDGNILINRMQRVGIGLE